MSPAAHRTLHRTPHPTGGILVVHGWTEVGQSWQLRRKILNIPPKQIAHVLRGLLVIGDLRGSHLSNTVDPVRYLCPHSEEWVKVSGKVYQLTSGS